MARAIHEIRIVIMSGCDENEELDEAPPLSPEEIYTEDIQRALDIVIDLDVTVLKASISAPVFLDQITRDAWGSNLDGRPLAEKPKRKLPVKKRSFR